MTTHDVGWVIWGVAFVCALLSFRSRTPTLFFLACVLGVAAVYVWR